MNDIDKKICEIIQRNGKISNTALAQAVGLPVSTLNDKLRRLENSGVIQEWRAILNPRSTGATLCTFLLVDMQYDGEAEAVEQLKSREEVLELHHISGPHSYLLKVRVADVYALQHFLSHVVKPLRAVTHTESLLALDSVKETTALAITSR